MTENTVNLFDYLNNRMNVSFFNVRFISLIKSIESIPHKPLYKLADFSSESWNQKDYFEEYFPYIEISAIDIQDGTITMIYNMEKTNAPSRARKIVRNNDIIISTTRPSRGAISIITNVNNITIASTGFAIIRKISDEIIREYLYIMLRQNSSLFQMEQRSSGGNYPAITEDELKKILIPLPPKETQQEIVDLYNHAVEEKQAEEQEAKTLLEGIDNYLLEELGIELSKDAKDKRYFEVNIQDLIGKRLDPIYYSFNFSQFQNKYTTIALKSICLDFQSGFGAGKEEQATEENGIIQIRPTNIDSAGELIFDKNVFVPDSLDKPLLEFGDILFNNTNSQELVGKTSILKENKKLFFSNHITRIKVNKVQIIPDYLWIILNLYQRMDVFYSLCTNWNNQSGVGIELLKFLEIPLPPIKKQNEIAEHILSIRSKAKQLQKEANEVIAKTKAEIEKMIIGE